MLKYKLYSVLYIEFLLITHTLLYCFVHKVLFLHSWIRKIDLSAKKTITYIKLYG